MNDSDLIQWLNNTTGSQISTIKEASSGMEICLALTDLANDRKAKKWIKNGKTLDERKNNFQLASSMFEQLGIAFNYDINKLAKGDRAEIRTLLQEIVSLTNEEDENQNESHEDADDNGIDIDGLIASLEEDLDQKLEAAKELSQQLDEVAEERNFYFDKLLKIEKACASYMPADADSILQILALSSGDFPPPKE